MRPNRSILPCLLLIVLGPGTCPARGGDPAPLEALKQKGLTRSGRTLVIEAEKPVLAKMKEVQAAFAGYSRLADRQAAAEQIANQLVALEERRVEFQENLNDLNQRINEQGMQTPRPGLGGLEQRGHVSEMIARRDLIKGTLTELTQEQKTLKSQAVDRKGLDEGLKKQGEFLKAALGELRRMVDEITTKYAELGADGSIKNAVGEQEKASKADLKLGPSEAFQAGVRALDQAERRLLGKKATATPKKKGKARK